MRAAPGLSETSLNPGRSFQRALYHIGFRAGMPARIDVQDGSPVVVGRGKWAGETGMALDMRRKSGRRRSGPFSLHGRPWNEEVRRVAVLVLPSPFEPLVILGLGSAAMYNPVRGNEATRARDACKA